MSDDNNKLLIKILDTINERMDRIDERLDKVEASASKHYEILAQQNVTLIKQGKDLEYHIKRSDQNEDSIGLLHQRLVLVEDTHKESRHSKNTKDKAIRVLAWVLGIVASGGFIERVVSYFTSK